MPRAAGLLFSSVATGIISTVARGIIDRNLGVMGRRAWMPLTVSYACGPWPSEAHRKSCPPERTSLLTAPPASEAQQARKVCRPPLLHIS